MECAARALGLIAVGNEDNQALIATEGAIVPLVSLLQDGADDAKEAAVDALMFLVTNHEKNCADIVREGAIPPLVKILEAGTDGQKRALRSC